ncbi:MAG: hypothetical protein N2B06_04805 [Clostridium sp.]
MNCVCFNKECVCDKILTDLSLFKFTMSTVMFRFNTDVTSDLRFDFNYGKFKEFINKDDLVVKEIICSEDFFANRKESKRRKTNGVKDSFYNTISIKRIVRLGGKDRNIHYQITNNTCRVIIPHYTLYYGLIDNVTKFFKDEYKGFEISKFNIITMTFIEKLFANRIFVLDDLKKDLQDNLDELDIRTIYYNRKLNNDRSIRIHYTNKNGSILVYRTGTISVAGINDVSFFLNEYNQLKKRILYI